MSPDQLAEQILKPWLEVKPELNFVSIHQLREKFVQAERTLAEFTQGLRHLQDHRMLVRIRDHDLQIYRENCPFA